LNKPIAVPPPPAAARRPHVVKVHGVELTDDYHWLRERDQPEVRAYLEAENAHVRAMMKPSVPLQRRLYREMLGRIKESDVEVAYRDGRFYYYSRTRKGQQYRIYCRKRDSLAAREEVILDLNELGRDKPYLGIGAMEVSPDGSLLAYSTDFTGYREYTAYVKNLSSGKLLDEKIEKVRSLTWGMDGRTLFFATEDETKRASKVWRKRLGEPEPVLLYEETDLRFSVGVGRTRSDRFIIISAHSATTSEVRFLPADQPESQPVLFLPRRHEHEYYVDHGGDVFYIVTNDRGRNFRLVSAPLDSFGEDRWQELIPHRDDIMLDGVDVFARYLVMHERAGGFPRLAVRRIADGETHLIDFPEPARNVHGGANAEFEMGTYRLGYASYVTPASVYDYDIESRRLRLLKQREVRGGYDPSQYRVELHYGVAQDGTRIPISLVYRKDKRRTGPQALLLTGYGAYGYPHDVDFSSSRLSLLDRGVIYACAHVRGGGEMGKRWHDQGRMLNKKNTFTDFIACAEHLVREHYTDPTQLVIEGGSAGGLLMGAVTNMRPELFRAVVAQVPFVDVVNTMLDETLPLTTGEYEEWGDPRDKRYFDFMLSYSPYDNIERKDYPAMLVETSLYDSQVMYWEPAKYVAKLRAMKTDHNPLLLKTNMKAGHGGSSGRYDFLKEIAFTYAFILGVVGLTR
jgi:oligopeptidase B